MGELSPEENAVLWGTGCTSCADLLDQNYRQYVALDKIRKMLVEPYHGQTDLKLDILRVLKELDA